MLPAGIEDGYCEGAFRQLTVGPQGNVAVCPAISIAFAKVCKNISLSDILTSEKWISLRRNLIRENCKGCWFACTKDKNVARE